jgi:hypothetical protein
MINKIKNNLKNIFVDVEGTTIAVSETSHKLNHAVPKPKIIRSLRTVADMERGKFRRMFDRHRVAYGY